MSANPVGRALRSLARPPGWSEAELALTRCLKYVVKLIAQDYTDDAPVSLIPTPDPRSSKSKLQSSDGLFALGEKDPSDD